MSPDSYLDICIATQQLSLLKNGQVIKTYPISTAKNGAGEIMGSGCTPRGWHCIRAKIGKEQPLYAVFKARRTTGEIYSPALAAQYPQRDWILTRILWLGGLEPHKIVTDRWIQAGGIFIYTVVPMNSWMAHRNHTAA